MRSNATCVATQGFGGTPDTTCLLPLFLVLRKIFVEANVFCCLVFLLFPVQRSRLGHGFSHIWGVPNRSIECAFNTSHHLPATKAQCRAKLRQVPWGFFGRNLGLG